MRGNNITCTNLNEFFDDYQPAGEKVGVVEDIFINI